MENQLNRKNPFTDKKTRKGPYITKKRKQQLEAYNNGQLNDQDAKDVEELMHLYEISKMKIPIEEQVKDLQRKGGKGVLNFPHEGVKYYDAKKILLIGNSGSGKSTQVLNLLAESPNAYEAVHLIAPESTLNNETYQTLKYYLNQANIKFYWTDCDIPEMPSFGDAEQKDKRGSSKYIHDNKLGMFIIFDDIYKAQKQTWVQQLMSDCFIKLRHRLINTIVCLQSANYMPSAVALNWSHLFISGNFLDREIWSKVRLPDPDNLNDAINDYNNNTPDKKHQFYYIKADDSIIHKYIPYQYSSKQQIIKKFTNKLPKGIDEALNMKTIRKSQKEQEEEEDFSLKNRSITNQETYEKMQDREIKNRPDTTLRNIQQVVNEEKKKKYYVFNGFKHYV